VVFLGKEIIDHICFIFKKVPIYTLNGPTLLNSPQFHIKIDDFDTVEIRNVVIYVDVDAQNTALSKAGLITKLGELGIPTFPLNTDGIDPAATNVIIDNVTITNYDDAVVMKPCRSNWQYCQCSGNARITNSFVNYGVGMSIGSVPPNPAVNCVRNVTFDNIHFSHPLKAIYIKPNPGTSGTGIIQDITYSNIDVDNALWYGLFIGLQQQHQPGGSGTGCDFDFPLAGSKCATQPLVTVDDIKLINVTFKNADITSMPGVILGDPTNPFTNIVFDNVQTSGDFVLELHYYCENAKGSYYNNNLPPSCLSQSNTPLSLN